MWGRKITIRKSFCPTAHLDFQAQLDSPKISNINDLPLKLFSMTLQFFFLESMISTKPLTNMDSTNTPTNCPDKQTETPPETSPIDQSN